VIRVLSDSVSVVLPPDDTALFSATTKAIVVTRAARGAGWYLSDGSHGEVAAPRIEPVDTTGAGDAASAAILWRLIWTHHSALTREALNDAVAYGCAAGSFACLREGAIPSLPSAAQVEAMLSQVASATPQN